MAVKIRLKRLGKIRVPQYRIVVVDSRKKRDGRVIEEIGKYHPKEHPSLIDVVSDRAQYWLGVGAQPTEAVEALLKITGDWQQHKGLPGTEGTLKTAEATTSKIDRFNEALKDVGGEPKAGATTKKAAAKKAADKPADKPAEDKADTKADIEPPADETPEGATAKAEDAETAQVDAEQAEAKGGSDDGAKADATPADEQTAAEKSEA